MANALDFENARGELHLAWPYFNTGPLLEVSSIDYSSPVPVVNASRYEWFHSLEDVIGSLLSAGLTIRSFHEYKTLPWQALPWMEPDGHGDFALPESQRNLCPLAFSLVAIR